MLANHSVDYKAIITGIDLYKHSASVSMEEETAVSMKALLSPSTDTFCWENVIPKCPMGGHVVVVDVAMLFWWWD